MPPLPKNLFAAGAFNAGTRFSRSAFEIFAGTLAPGLILSRRWRFEFAEKNNKNGAARCHSSQKTFSP